MTEHQEPEREADELAERSEQLGDKISDVRKDWDDKKAKVIGDEPSEAPDDDRAPWPDE
jgi:hypothetical protein